LEYICDLTVLDLARERDFQRKTPSYFQSPFPSNPCGKKYCGQQEFSEPLDMLKGW
jgi:hypothetical protein